MMLISKLYRKWMDRDTENVIKSWMDMKMNVGL